MEVETRNLTVSDIYLKLVAIKFAKGIYFWVGDENLSYNDLQCAFPLKNIKDEDSTGTTLIGELDSLSLDISKALAKRYGMPIFMSINVQDSDYLILKELQEKLFKTIFELFPLNKDPHTN
ncbi:hypothetical protein BEWA_033620 [Theileria equi strain WA]|uniref:Proteasome assembly chaperone 4 n=1 Tax=Theileria equi strain WA TaxID=1537102 RepID=L0AY47_THEEQ|nr:hypothetical protein BEWA_033620 [Theileria equi strain WA]AFZ80507.1 hypothetical protein BEWA_033620 [Theileria equi strain WA]|eukprot:XP_004830173.1 hypothetical protein BEWA_033620 [Theileria equi strain WA]